MSAIIGVHDKRSMGVHGGRSWLELFWLAAESLQAAWELFTPVLKEIETRGISPELYPYGSRGPVGAHYLAAKFGVRWGDVAGDEGE